MSEMPPEPGEVADLEHGIPGPAEEMPENDADFAELSLVNEDDEEEDDE